MSKKTKKRPQPQKPFSLKNYIQEAARKLPIYRCLQMGDEERGILQIVVGRKRNNGQIIVGFYLIDLFCLGLKDTFFSVFDDEDDFDEKMEKYSEDGDEFYDLEPNLAYNYIYGSIEFAEDIGFKPHKEFSTTEYILEDVEKIDYLDIEFGKNGKPYFIAGEKDKKGVILAHLDKHVGVGNYDYILEEDFNEEVVDEYKDEDDDSNFSLFDDYDYETELEEFREMEQEDFSKYIAKIAEELPKSQQADYLFIMILAISLVEVYPDIYQLSTNYKTNPKEVFKKVKKYCNEHVPQLKSVDLDINELFIQIAIENYLQFEGPEFLCLEDFIQALSVFKEGKEDILEDFDSLDAKLYNVFIIPFSQKIELNLAIILQLITSVHLKESNYFELNIFKKNIVAAKAVELINLADFDNIPADWHFMSNFLIKHFILSDFVPDLIDNELLTKLVNLKFPKIQK